MHFRSHLLASTLAGIALYPRSPRRAALVALSGVLIDVDHYVLYALRSGDWNPVGALRYYKRRSQPFRPGDTRPRYGPLRSIAHHAPLTIPLLWLLAWGWPRLRPLAVGVTLHLAMDQPWTYMLDWRVWRRARGRCERCGARDRHLDVYHIVPTSYGGDFWALENRAAWCGPCAKAVRDEQNDAVLQSRLSPISSARRPTPRR